MRLIHPLLSLGLAAALASAVPTAAAPARSKLLANTTGKTVLRKVIFNNDLSMAVVSRSGTAVVCDPQNMPPGVIPDAITVSHRHHLNATYMQEAAAARAFVQQLGTWTVGDIRITGIPGAHSNSRPNPTAPDIVIYLFEVDGLRVAYFACDAQQDLEPAQQAALGKVDVALITAENGQGLSTARARGLMKQLGARVVVPLSHHVGDVDYNNEVMAELAGGKLETVDGELALSPAELGAGPRVVHVVPTSKP